MDNIYLDAEMESWEEASENDCDKLFDAPRIPRLPRTKQFYVPWTFPRTKQFYVPWTFRRVYRVWGLWAALRFLVKG